MKKLALAIAALGTVLSSVAEAGPIRFGTYQDSSQFVVEGRSWTNYSGTEINNSLQVDLQSDQAAILSGVVGGPIRFEGGSLVTDPVVNVNISTAERYLEFNGGSTQTFYGTQSSESSGVMGSQSGTRY